MTFQTGSIAPASAATSTPAVLATSTTPTTPTILRRATARALTISLLFAILQYEYTTPVFAQDQSLHQHFNTTEVLESHVDRLFSLSTESPVAAALRKPQYEKQRKILNETFDFIEALDRVVANRVEANHSQACNVAFQYKWSSVFKRYSMGFQIGEPNTECFSRVDVDNAVKAQELDVHFPESIRKNINASRSVLFSAASQSIPLPNDGNWSNGVFEMIPAIDNRAGQVCNVQSVTAYRRSNVWYLRSVVTNANIDENLPHGNRHLIIEWVPRDLSQSLTMVHPNYETRVNENSTTLLVVWRGKARAEPTQGGSSLDDPISPATQAYRQNLVAVDLAKDSVTISNIAILALPLVMNVVPFSFVADLKGIGMLIYVLVTDVFSTIPLLVKGVELIRSSQPRREILASFHAAAGRPGVGKIEVWRVKYSGKSQFRKMGIAFVIIAIVALFVGIFVELWAIVIMKRIRKEAKKGETVEGPFGPVLSEETLTGLLGTRRNNAKRIYFSQRLQEGEDYAENVPEYTDDPLVGAASLAPMQTRRSVLSRIPGNGDGDGTGHASRLRSNKHQ